MEPLAHQRKFVSGYDGSNILVHEGGTGKTVCACLWLRDGRDADALVVCPKRVVRKWEKALRDWGTKATVLSKEQFKKTSLRQWSAIVLDEADEFASPLFTKARSQLTEKAYELVRNYPTQTLLLTATPVRSNPWNLHTVLALSGRYIDWKRWRDRFFELVKMPYMARPGWMPKKNWRTDIRTVMEKYCDIVLLRDVTDVPESPAEIYVTTDPGRFVFADGVPTFHDEHLHEQTGKPKEILRIAKAYRKVIVIAYRRPQIEELKKTLSKDRETFAIWGGMSPERQEEEIEKAQESDECFFIVQASLGVGFDGDRFSVGIFASMSYSVRDHVQMKFRFRRIHNLHPVQFYYLFGGRCDRAVFENVQAGRDFVPSEYML